MKLACPSSNLPVMLLLLAFALAWPADSLAQELNSNLLDINALPPIPDAIGVAGPLVGIHNDTLIVAGGANFAEPDHPQLWDLPKKYHDQIWA